MTHGRMAHVLFSMGEVERALGGDATNAATERTTRRRARHLRRDCAACMRSIAIAENLATRLILAIVLPADLAEAGNAAEQQLVDAAIRSRAGGRAACRVVFFINDQQYEVEDVPKISESRMRVRLRAESSARWECAKDWCNAQCKLGSEAKFEEALRLFGQAGGDRSIRSPLHTIKAA